MDRREIIGLELSGLKKELAKLRKKCAKNFGGQASKGSGRKILLPTEEQLRVFQKVAGKEKELTEKIKLAEEALAMPEMDEPGETIAAKEKKAREDLEFVQEMIKKLEISQAELGNYLKCLLYLKNIP